MKSIVEQQYMLSVLHSQYHACWCSGDFRSQGISRHDINPQKQNILSPASEELSTNVEMLQSLTDSGLVMSYVVRYKLTKDVKPSLA